MVDFPKDYSAVRWKIYDISEVMKVGLIWDGKVYLNSGTTVFDEYEIGPLYFQKWKTNWRSEKNITYLYHLKVLFKAQSQLT